jgi:hypothetical protein
MSVPVGTWDVVTDLNNWLLNITNVDGQGNVTGTIQPDASDTYNITGTWNSAGNQLNFSYSFPINEGGLRTWRLVSFQGYFFQAGKPLFSGNGGQQPPLGPVSTPVWNMMAGTWSVGIALLGHSLPQYGWVARSQNQI